jgi:hypothetical protein
MRKLKILYLPVLVVFFLGLIHFLWVVRNGQVVTQTTLNISRLLMDYIDEKREFPKSQMDLEKEGYLKVVRTENGATEYYKRTFVFNPNNPKESDKIWRRIYEFEIVSVLYGFNTNQIIIKDSRLYDKRFPAQQVLIVNGPLEQHLKRTLYEPMTLQIYSELLKVTDANIAGTNDMR